MSNQQLHEAIQQAQKACEQAALSPEQAEAQLKQAEQHLQGAFQATEEGANPGAIKQIQDAWNAIVQAQNAVRDQANNPVMLNESVDEAISACRQIRNYR
ncbi:hypothetical protein EV207_15110 [Scopulibacillus darangshiensis]|uniref:Uncharacterized protein n=1 Tax=Scopulibacillus darangshiensis TaxID=442528 RepID=A0A4R2NHL5_9BACL|nr:hypothetical protein [Scopulibacillus darangshiensis]TCP20644.1 hypothetical protein EV207_15110 [Scopulibacillus darangshiensis]